MSNNTVSTPIAHDFQMTNLRTPEHEVCADEGSVSQAVQSVTQQFNIDAKIFVPVHAKIFVPVPKPVPQLSSIKEENSKDIACYDDSEQVSLHPLSLSTYPEIENEVNLSPCSESSSYSSFSLCGNYNLDSVPNSSASSEEKKEDFEEVSWVTLDEEDDEESDEYDEDEEDDNLKFMPKFKGNPAKGNFYISKENITRMIQKATGNFITDHPFLNDEKLAFDYFKQSVAMQINDDQIHIHRTPFGKRIIIDIDLHFANNNQRMYLVAMLNAKGEFREKVKWQIVDFMSKQEIARIFNITAKQLPKSSRKTAKFERLLATQPWNLPMDIVDRTAFHKLPGKRSRRKAAREQQQKPVEINEEYFKNCVKASWNNNSMIPVVVIKGQRQWIEWKKLICCGAFYVAISLRYYPSNRKWKIECMDYDGGRIYYQHRLIGDIPYNVTYVNLASCINTSMKILK